MGIETAERHMVKKGIAILQYEKYSLERLLGADSASGNGDQDGQTGLSEKIDTQQAVFNGCIDDFTVCIDKLRAKYNMIRASAPDHWKPVKNDRMDPKDASSLKRFYELVLDRWVSEAIGYLSYLQSRLVKNGSASAKPLENGFENEETAENRDTSSLIHCFYDQIEKRLKESDKTSFDNFSKALAMIYSPPDINKEKANPQISIALKKTGYLLKMSKSYDFPSTSLSEEQIAMIINAPVELEALEAIYEGNGAGNALKADDSKDILSDASCNPADTLSHIISGVERYGRQASFYEELKSVAEGSLDPDALSPDAKAVYKSLHKPVLSQDADPLMVMRALAGKPGGTSLNDLRKYDRKLYALCRYMLCSSLNGEQESQEMISHQAGQFAGYEKRLRTANDHYEKFIRFLEKDDSSRANFFKYMDKIERQG